MTCRVTPHTRRVGVLEQVDDQGVLDAPRCPGRPGPRAARRSARGEISRAGGVAAGVGDPVAVVAALAGQGDLAVRVAVELGAEARRARAPARAPR